MSGRSNASPCEPTVILVLRKTDQWLTSSRPGWLWMGQLAVVILGIHLAADRPMAAADDLRRAVFIAPQSWLARYWYILALRAVGSNERAEGQVRELARQLAQRPDGEILEDGTTRVGELREALATLEAFYD